MKRTSPEHEQQEGLMVVTDPTMARVASTANLIGRLGHNLFKIETGQCGETKIAVLYYEPALGQPPMTDERRAALLAIGAMAFRRQSA